MKVIVADEAGVCFGVRRALDMVLQESSRGEKLATLGPLIHNPQVVQMLEEKGICAVSSVAEARGGGVVLPSHGVSREVRGEAEAAGARIIDATCPFVAVVQRKVEELSADGFRVVIFGDPGHSEVRAIVSAAGEGAVVVESAEQARLIDWSGERVGIVSQTTQEAERFGEVVGVIARRARETAAFNTICHATARRQEAARELASRVQAMFVVGGRNSANTTRLAEICRSRGVPTYHIETASEIQPEWTEGLDTVGLTAGASTPDWIIEEVRESLERM